MAYPLCVEWAAIQLSLDGGIALLMLMTAVMYGKCQSDHQEHNCTGNPTRSHRVGLFVYGKARAKQSTSSNASAAFPLDIRRAAKSALDSFFRSVL